MSLSNLSQSPMLVFHSVKVHLLMFIRSSTLPFLPPAAVLRRAGKLPFPKWAIPLSSSIFGLILEIAHIWTINCTQRLGWWIKPKPHMLDSVGCRGVCGGLQSNLEVTKRKEMLGCEASTNAMRAVVSAAMYKVLGSTEQGMVNCFWQSHRRIYRGRMTSLELDPETWGVFKVENRDWGEG